MHCPFNILILCMLYAIAGGALDKRLKYYEFVQPSDARRRLVKRGTNNADGAFNRIEELNFFAFDRQFHLYLSPKRGLFSSEFESVELTDGNKVVDYVDVDPDEFMEGYVFGESNSRVTANVDEYGAISALIQLVDEVFTVEPAWRYFRSSPLGESIMYRHSDLLLDTNHTYSKRPLCAASDRDLYEIPLEGHSSRWHLSYRYDNESVELDRFKRATFSVPSLRVPEKNRCAVKLVADYRFHENIGRTKASLTSRYLINLIDRVNAIFTSTVWQDSEHQPGITNMGFVIKKILIHASPTKQSGHYNSNTTDWNSVDRLLQNFSEAEGSKEYCLVHLFTYQSFPNGVLGLGFVASQKEGTSGGICSAPVSDGFRFFYYNTALSSAKSSFGGPVVTREADIVTAHEFGHNWGSPHDPANVNCSPPSKVGGSYIMYTYSVSGYDENNKRFSPCSRRTIKGVLEAKAHLCFQEEEVSFCGNQRVEPGEECDEGLLGDSDDGICCTADCKLRPNAICSPKNSLCCSSRCQYERSSTKCRYGDQNRCLRDAFCNGSSAECPPSQPYNNFEPCLDGGECQNGTCVSFCEKRSIRMKPCICENVTQTCFRCCRRSGGSECTPYLSPGGGMPFNLSAGTRCIHGHCYGGVCVKEATDFIQHLWRIIDKLDSSSFWKFLYDNIVGTVIVATLIVWIPASCFVYRWDEAARRARQQNLDYIVADILVSDSDRVTVIQGIKSIPGWGHDNAAATVV